MTRLRGSVNLKRADPRCEAPRVRRRMPQQRRVMGRAAGDYLPLAQRR